MGRRSFGQIKASGKLKERYFAQYTGPDLKIHKHPGGTFPTKTDAEGWLSRERRLIDLEQWTPPGTRAVEAKHAAEEAAQLAATEEAARVRFGPFSRAVVDDNPNLSARGREAYHSLLKHHVNPTFEDVVIEDITPEQIRTWYRKIKPVRKGVETSFETTKRRAAECLKMVLNQAVRDKTIRVTTSPYELELTKLIPEHVTEPLSPAEVDRLAKALPDRFQAVALLAGYCGLRWGEIFELRRKDIIGKAEKVSVTRQFQRSGGEDRIVRPKSGSVGEVIIPTNIRPAVLHHLEHHVTKGRDALLFPREVGGKANTREYDFRPVFKQALADIGREDFRFHDQRHTAGTVAAQAGGTLPEVMARLRHSTPAAAMRYQKIAAGRDEWLAARIAEISTKADDTPI